MTLQITGKNLDMGSAFRTYVEERIEQRLEKFLGEQISGHVRLEKEGAQFRTNCSLTLRSGLQLQSHAESEDAYASADGAIERLEKRLRRYTRRLKEHHNRDNETPAMVEVSDYVVDAADQEDSQDISQNPVIIAETRTPVHVSTVSDAVMQLDLSESAILVFKNAGHGRINVVYRREDGNIGWIDPQNETSV